MRICSIITSFTNGGAEMLVANLSNAYVAEGHESAVISLCHAADVGNSPKSETKIMERVETGGGTAISLGIRNRHNIFSGMRALKKQLELLQPDIIHVHTARALLYFVGAGPKIPIILTHHNSKLSFPPLTFKLFDRLVSSYVAISDECKGLIKKSATRPVIKIRNAAGTAFRTGSPRTLPQQHFEILCVGAISEQKNYQLLIRAAPLLEKLMEESGKSILIQVAGDGAGIDQLQKMTQKANADKIMTFLGSCDDVPDLIKTADLFVNCSKYEGLPLAILEAMSGGLPIVATDVAGNKELVDHDRNGLRIPLGKPELLAQAIADVLQDSDRYRAMSIASLAKSKDYAIEASAEKHLALYGKTVSVI